MRTLFAQALLVSGLLSFASVTAASGHATTSGQDMEWMKQQQQALQQFMNGLHNRTVQLPPQQEDLIKRLQDDIQNQQNRQEASGKRTFKAIYFVSLGLPREGLLPALRDANHYGIPATVRGLVNNDVRQTASAMFELAKEDKNTGVQIDPTLFSEYGITAVPALVVTCPGRYDVIRGSLPLKQALEKVVESGECADTARQLLEGTR
ncbi:MULTISPECIES: type-F conjugative transfer system pilin assembly protein TrbC [Atlantibacter]|uniref:type-F conjugative transfer system pilin assembly protein TrbC n=1 Tax=Atlantibacter TaxID=1903434 RepID=UPI00178C2E05|nr:MULTISPECIES: type-F conjugative transfer system pilin assembly protein TrbC [Atlantibacter]MDW2745006.1 type-F conjugative transfer system pilin assembly protein TrbC [Atlantibacter subterranea]